MRDSSESIAGIGLRSGHYAALLEQKPAIGWLEVHPENYFCGGVHLHMLGKARELYPVSFHAVGLSLGSDHPVDAQHLRQLKTLVDRFDPVRVSDHASWSASGNAHLNDLLPLPYNEESLIALCRNIDVTQRVLGRQILIENPSTYVAFNHSTLSEAQFLVEAASLTGCGLLLDVNNIYVQAHNHGFDAYDYIEQIPRVLVQEIHLAGHISQAFAGGTLLVDTHDQPVCNGVWDLYLAAVRRFGAVPTLIEWDKNLPEFDVLVAEAVKAGKLAVSGAYYAIA
jgi:uncharacterized protein